MFWIGMFVGVIVGIAITVGVCTRVTLKRTGLSFDEFSEVVFGLEDVGYQRDSEVRITCNKGTELEGSQSIEFTKG